MKFLLFTVALLPCVLATQETTKLTTPTWTLESGLTITDDSSQTYTLLGLLGRGGEGEVWRATRGEDTEGKTYALKFYYDHEDAFGRGFDETSSENEQSYLELFQRCHEFSSQVPEPLGIINTGSKYLSQELDTFGGETKPYEVRIVLIMEDMIYESLYSIKEQLSIQGKTFSRKQLVQIWDETSELYSKLVKSANFGWSELTIQNVLWDDKTAAVIKEVNKVPPHIPELITSFLPQVRFVDFGSPNVIRNSPSAWGWEPEYCKKHVEHCFRNLLADLTRETDDQEDSNRTELYPTKVMDDNVKPLYETLKARDAYVRLLSLF